MKGVSKTLLTFCCVVLFLFLACKRDFDSASHSRDDSKLIFLGNFETGDLTGFKQSGNSPTVVSFDGGVKPRAGKFMMKSYLNFNTSKVRYRTEVVRADRKSPGKNIEIEKEYWYGFSIYLPKSYVPDDCGEIVAQWHGRPDFDLGENWRNPVSALSTTGGHWTFLNRWDAKANTFANGEKEYGGTKKYDLETYETGKWTDWVVHVLWSFHQDGFLQVWKDGKMVIDQPGPNCFNDKAGGPYFKMGLYKHGWKKQGATPDVVSERVLYHDEFRLGGEDCDYDSVAP